MNQKRELPAPMERLLEHLKKEFNGETVEFEALDSADRYYITIISAKFIDVPDLQRQDNLWAMVDQICSREETMMVGAIWALAPGEITEFLNSI